MNNLYTLGGDTKQEFAPVQLATLEALAASTLHALDLAMINLRPPTVEALEAVQNPHPHASIATERAARVGTSIMSPAEVQVVEAARPAEPVAEVMEEAVVAVVSAQPQSPEDIMKADALARVYQAHEDRAAGRI